MQGLLTCRISARGGCDIRRLFFLEENMAYNDYLVILYKILKYVDEAQKAGKPV